MPKNIVLLSARQDKCDYDEIRDAIDIRWYQLLSALDIQPLIMPAVIHKDITKLLINNILGIVLTGGNDIGSNLKRDEMEAKLLSYAIQLEIPVIGYCRGMQMINNYYGGSLRKISGHISTRHHINSHTDFFKFSKTVNSFHSFGIDHDNLGNGLNVLATSDDGTIEAIAHQKHNVYGFMWHPEREKHLDKNDINNFKKIIGDL